MRWLSIGVSFFVTGLVEKVLVADSLAAWVDPAFAHQHMLSTLGAWSAMLGYTFQIYFDFSGYSSMAVGLGFMFGLRIPQNFNSPYKALDPSDFWRRWHISLSSCLRDYVYIPLGGNRGEAWQTYRNLLLTMLIGGLWHGANWTFVIWGAYHGILLALYRRFGSGWNALPPLVRQMAMFALTVVSWVFFRAKTISDAVAMLRTMFTPTRGEPLPAMLTFAVLLVIAATWAMAGPNPFELHESFRWRTRRAIVLATAFGGCLAIMSSGAATPFLYFQF
jgi:alginate O-acetyltransferase complex protein AlgI